MSEHTHSGGESAAQLEKIDLFKLLDRFWQGLKRFWWLIVALAILGGFVSYFNVSHISSTSYTAWATLSVSANVNSEGSSDNYLDVATASQLAKVYPYIFTSGILSDRVAEDLGLDYVPGSISVTAVEDSNVITISVTDSDGERAYQTLQVLIEDYPEIAQFVVGQTTTHVIRESGVPEAESWESVTRGSLQRGAATGFVAGLLIVFLLSLLRRTVRSSADLKRVLHLRCLETIPLCRLKKRRKKKADDMRINVLEPNIREDYTESIRSLRSRVEHRMEESGAKTLMVTSSVPGEGKSTVAANLAIAFAQKGKKVILLDCDLRNPSVQGILNLEGEYGGLAAVLEGKQTLDEALIQSERVPELWLLPSTPESERNADVGLLGTPQMKVLLDELKQRADLVVLDTSPAAMLSDAEILARNVDAALYVVRYDHTRIRHVVEGVEALSHYRIHLLGYVLNASRVSSGVGNYGYRYGHKYGYGYGKYGYGYGYGSHRHSHGETADEG